MLERANRTVLGGRRDAGRILRQQDKRLLVIVGPCSIHDPQAALEYARRLQSLRDELSDHLCIIMRVYFEKPRTIIGWKGLINDAGLDGTQDMNEGLRVARKLLLDINEMGLPAAAETLDPTTPQYMGDLVSWAAIGARTTESQAQREMASGLSMPVGFKNSTSGDLQVAVDAIESARHGHSFLGIDAQGRSAIVLYRRQSTRASRAAWWRGKAKLWSRSTGQGGGHDGGGRHQASRHYRRLQSRQLRQTVSAPGGCVAVGDRAACRRQ
jgi:3-deoxy-7-phosphoheptulonate synthase